MTRVRLRDPKPPPCRRDDGPLARENARLRRCLVEAERELSLAERSNWSGGRSALEPHMKGALSVLRAGLDQ